MIAMAHALDLEVIAEGVENRSQAGFLLVHHCELGQGFLYSEPVDVPTLREHLALEPALTA
jgi:EAL domain-containing protein (putative c-di-GMP-specific phosphodiesterase class I)